MTVPHKSVLLSPARGRAVLSDKSRSGQLVAGSLPAAEEESEKLDVGTGMFETCG